MRKVWKVVGYTFTIRSVASRAIIRINLRTLACAVRRRAWHWRCTWFCRYGRLQVGGDILNIGNWKAAQTIVNNRFHRTIGRASLGVAVAVEIIHQIGGRPAPEAAAAHLGCYVRRVPALRQQMAPGQVT